MINKVYERLNKIGQEEMRFYEGEVEAYKKIGSKPPATLIQNMNDRMNAYNNLKSLLSDKSFDFDEGCVEERIKNVESKLIDVQCKEKDGVEYLEAEFDNFYIRITNEDVVKYGLGQHTSLLPVAVVLALKYIEFKVKIPSDNTPIEDIEFEALADAIDVLDLIQILKDKNINTLGDLQFEFLGNCSECDVCGCKDNMVTRLAYEFKFDEATKKLVKCAEDDDDVIYDFIIYVCNNCKKVSYYLEIV